MHQCDLTHPCRAEPIVAWAAEAVWDEQLDDADLHKSWRRQRRLVGLNPSWEQGQWSDRSHYHVLEADGLDMATPHDLRHCEWTRGGLTANVSRDVRAQARVDSELALWREWADNDDRRELLPCPLLEPVILANKRAQRRPHEAPAIKAALGVTQAGWWTQEVSNKAGIAEHPVVPEMRTSCGGLCTASIVGMSSLS